MIATLAECIGELASLIVDPLLPLPQGLGKLVDLVLLPGLSQVQTAVKLLLANRGLDIADHDAYKDVLKIDKAKAAPKKKKKTAKK